MAKAASHSLVRALGARIRSLREARNWSQEELAHAARIDRSYMSGIERGVRNISVINLAKIAKALSVSVAELFEK